MLDIESPHFEQLVFRAYNIKNCNDENMQDKHAGLHRYIVG